MKRLANAFAAWVLAVGFLILPAAAQTFALPPDPIAPTSSAQCSDLYEQYHAIWLQVMQAAKDMGRQADSVLDANGLRAAEPYYREASRLLDVASQVTNDGAAARLRCNNQVYAYQRAQAAEARDDATSPARIAAVQYGSEFAGTLPEKALDLYDEHRRQLGKPPSDLSVTIRGALRVVELNDIFNDVRTVTTGSNRYDRIQALGNLFTGAVGWAFELSDVQVALMRASIGTLLSINRDAMNQLETALDTFDTDGGMVSGQVSAFVLHQNRVLAGEDSEGDDGLVDRANAAASRLGELRDDRAAAALAAIPRPPPTSSTNGGQSAGGGNGSYNSTQCSQLSQQIREINSAISQVRANLDAYGAAGADYLRELGHALSVNQSEFRRGCQ